jgi:NAD(P)-dependent dehydrogenase (short-subunit alcohol dehydrogenase family)
MKRILITGATSGIGKALAIHCQQNGYSVTACGRNRQALDLLASTYGISTLQFDVTDIAQATSALSEGEWDVIVLNAGTCEYVDVNQFDSALFRRVFEPNFFGVVNCVEALMPSLKEGSQLVIIDSMARLLPFTRAEAYGASKAALFNFAKSLSLDLRAKGIIVQTISPGFVETPLTDKNDFEMPMKVSVDVASASILNAIENKHRTFFFPRIFGWIMRALSKLPTAIQLAVSVSTMKQGKK